VIAAAAALMLSRDAPVRLADLAGDQPALLALGPDPDTGLRDWLCTGPQAPVDALDRFAIDATPHLSVLPAGTGWVAGALPEAGAALAVALRDDPRATVVDVGVLGAAAAPALDALVEVADASVIVLRSCYLALRRAVRLEATSRASGAVLVEEGGRALAARDVASVLGVPVLATVPVRGTVARAVDAGVLASRLPDGLARPVRDLVRRLGGPGWERAA
jgi:hypothetical protein